MYWGFTIKKFLLILLFPLVSLSAADKGAQSSEPEVYQTDVDFRGFAWGTSMDDVIKKMGKPISRETINGMESLLWENVVVQGYATYMVAYFSATSGLQGGVYYFLTYTPDEDMLCYSEVRQELRDRFGPTFLFDGIIRELRPYECAWDLPGGYVYLKINTRIGDPVTLLYFSPELARKVIGPGGDESVTAKK